MYFVNKKPWYHLCAGIRTHIATIRMMSGVSEFSIQIAISRRFANFFGGGTPPFFYKNLEVDQCGFLRNLFGILNNLAGTQ